MQCSIEKGSGKLGKRSPAQFGIVVVLEIRNQVIGFHYLDQPLAVCSMFRKSLHISASISWAVK